MSWYAVHCRSGSEAAVHAAFLRDGVSDLFPFYRQKVRFCDRQQIVDRPIFPGYLFASFDDTRSRIQILSTVGVLRILGWCSYTQRNSSVPDSEIDTVRKLLSSPDSLAAAVPALYQPKATDLVEVTYGPFVGMQGLVTRVKGKIRVWVSIPSMMAGVPVEVDAQSLRRIKPAA